MVIKHKGSSSSNIFDPVIHGDLCERSSPCPFDPPGVRHVDNLDGEQKRRAFEGFDRRCQSP